MISIEILDNGIYDGHFLFDSETKKCVIDASKQGGKSERVIKNYQKKYVSKNGVKKSFFDYCMTLKNKRVLNV